MNLKQNCIRGKGRRTPSNKLMSRTMLTGRFQKELLLLMSLLFWSLQSRHQKMSGFIQKKSMPKSYFQILHIFSQNLMALWPKHFFLNHSNETQKVSLYDAMRASDNRGFKGKHRWALNYSLKILQGKWRRTMKGQVKSQHIPRATESAVQTRIQ